MRISIVASLALAGIVITGGGCSSLRVIEGSPVPPKWVADPTMAPNYNPTVYVYASGISTYSLVLESGINDARHDAIRKIAERVAVAADDTYRTDRTDKRSSSQKDMPNVPQMIYNSRAAVDTSNTSESKQTRSPQARHVTQTRLHEMDQAVLSYTVWQYGPSFWAKYIYGDTAIRFYDVYVLMQCPKTEFNAVLQLERKLDALPDTIRAPVGN